jgi:hypothetical protein
MRADIHYGREQYASLKGRIQMSETSYLQIGISSLRHNRKQTSSLFDHIVGGGEQRLRHGQAERRRASSRVSRFKLLRRLGSSSK